YPRLALLWFFESTLNRYRSGVPIEARDQELHTKSDILKSTPSLSPYTLPLPAFRTVWKILTKHEKALDKQARDVNAKLIEENDIFRVVLRGDAGRLISLSAKLCLKEDRGTFSTRCLLLLVDPPLPLGPVQGVFRALSHIAHETSMRIPCEHHQHNVHHYPVITAPIDRHRLVGINFVLLEVEGCYVTRDKQRSTDSRTAVTAKAFPAESTSGYAHFARMFFEKHVNIVCNGLLTLYGDTSWTARPFLLPFPGRDSEPKRGESSRGGGSEAVLWRLRRDRSYEITAAAEQTSFVEFGQDFNR
ncbi:hypothetical protein DBV15_11161, partial [Temnothorax longispinosus]